MAFGALTPFLCTGQFHGTERTEGARVAMASRSEELDWKSIVKTWCKRLIMELYEWKW